MDKETRYSLAKLKALEDGNVHTWMHYDSIIEKFLNDRKLRSYAAEKLLEGIQEICFPSTQDYDGDEDERATELILNAVKEFKKENE